MGLFSKDNDDFRLVSFGFRQTMFKKALQVAFEYVDDGLYMIRYGIDTKTTAINQNPKTTVTNQTTKTRTLRQGCTA